MLKARIYEYEQAEAPDLERFYGAKGEIAWGSRSASYVAAPYTLAKDTPYRRENSNIGPCSTVHPALYRGLPARRASGAAARTCAPEEDETA